jgi:hypothetical protein
MGGDYVCIRCTGLKNACTFHRGDGRHLPLLCGPDANGYLKCCDWLEVPPKIQTKQPR